MRQVKNWAVPFHTTHPPSRRAASVCASRSQDWCCRASGRARARPGTIWRTTQGLTSIYAHGCKRLAMPQQNFIKLQWKQNWVFFVFILKCQKAPSEDQSCLLSTTNKFQFKLLLKVILPEKSTGLPCLICFCLVWDLSQHGLQIVQQRN